MVKTKTLIRVNDFFAVAAAVATAGCIWMNMAKDFLSIYDRFPFNSTESSLSYKLHPTARNYLIIENAFMCTHTHSSTQPC